MSKTKQSPAPWNMDFDSGRVDDFNGDPICFLAGGPTTQSIMNGWKIAAAPELLEALKELLDYLGVESDSQPKLNLLKQQANAAIRKAEASQ